MATMATTPEFLIVNPHKGRKRDILKYLVTKNTKSGMSFLDSSDERVKSSEVINHWWTLLFCITVTRILDFLSTPTTYLGYVVDFFLNLISQNGGLFGILKNLLLGKLKIPFRDADNFVSTMGQLDGRIDLYRTVNLAEKVDDSIATDENNIKADLGNRYLMDLCIMASKLAYENENVIKKVVEIHWKMHFVAFHNCWVESQQESCTQLFIISDKPKDANLIVVSFRGTETFSTHDLIADLDFSWYNIPKVGKVHVGFLEALGLGSRNNVTSFQRNLKRQYNTSFLHLNSDSEASMLELSKNSAYYTVALSLKDLLKEHKNAEFVVTGHSLGGALAIMFASVLVIQEETEMLERLLNVYTFGQPRIGDVNLGTFMEDHLNYPTARYYRVVYCNDLVPRVPFDDEAFAYKHFGTCLYYDSLYFGKLMDEEPNKNYFGLIYIIPMRWNSLFELLRSFVMKYIYGPDYEESWFSTFFRLMGLVSPGMASHSPVNYVNSVRLGRMHTAPLESLKSFARKL